MSAEITAIKNANAAGYKITHVLLNNAANTTAGTTSPIAFAGEYILDIQGSFGGGARVNVFCKRAAADDFTLIKSLSNSLSAQYTTTGQDILCFSKGDQVYAQLDNISGTPSIDVKLTYFEGK